MFFPPTFLRQTLARKYIQRPVQIPCIVAKMASKFQLSSAEKITLDEIFGENNVVNQFLCKVVWKDNIVSNSSIPADADLGNSTTHWWKKFQVIPFPAAQPATIVTTAISADRLLANQLPSVQIQPLSHRHQPSGMKRPLPQDPQDDGNNKDKEMRVTKGKDDVVKEAVGVKERKRRKLSTGGTLNNREMFFRPVSHINIRYHSYTNARQ